VSKSWTRPRQIAKSNLPFKRKDLAMELVLKSKLSNCAPDLARPDQALAVLLVYEDPRFINSTMELLRESAGRIEATGRLFCTIWDFGFFDDPLLIQIAGREVAAADIIVIAEHGCAELRDNIKAWLSLWVLMHTGRPTGISALHCTEECSRRASPDNLSHLQELGRLGAINLHAFGGSGPVAAELTRVMQRALAHPSHEFLDTAQGCLWLGQAAREEEHLRRSRTAWSGCPPVHLSSMARCKKTAATEQV
jgi:hypothetical protein